MNSRAFLPLALALALHGCSTYTDAELAQFRQRGVRPELVANLENDRPNSPAEIIELKLAGVSNEQILRNLDEAGLDYAATRADVSQLRHAGVSPLIIDAVLRESDRFAARYAGPEYGSAYYGGPWGSRYYGDWSFGFGTAF